MSTKMISIAADYSTSPAGRTPADGPFNGQKFREEILVPALRAAIARGEVLAVDLDGAFSYSSSFLEEVFGGLVRSGGFSAADIEGHLELRSSDPIYASFVKDAQLYLAEALKARAH
jgi:STAS-like domain of unknown function (DUF4325)